MKNYNITPELMEEAGKVESLEELMELAKNHQLELTKEDAEKFLASLEKTKNEGEISDEELDNVAGGGACDESSYGKPTCPDFYGSTTADLENTKQPAVDARIGISGEMSAIEAIRDSTRQQNKFMNKSRKIANHEM